MGQYVMGLDNGGTSTKAAIFDLQGREIATAGKQTSMITPKSGYTERDMEELWLANCDCIKRALEKAGIDGKDVLGIAVCGHGKGLYPWGKDGKPAYNGIISTDSRAWKYPEKWHESGVYDEVHDRLCQEFMACQQVSLLAWLKDHERAVYDNIRYAFSVKDYVRFRLTGEAYSEATDISGSGLMNVRDASFDRDILEKLGIGEAYDMLPPLRYSYDLCGTISEEAAKLTGLPAGTPVAGGMFDIDACAVAVDITSPEKMCTIAGTWSINEYIAEKPVMDGSIAMNSLFAMPGYYLVEECSATSSGNLEWFLENCMDHEPIPEGENIYSTVCDDYSAVYDAVSRLIRSGSRRILYLYTSYSYSGLNKMDGYKAALTSCGLPVQEDLIHQCSKNLEDARDLLLRLSKQGLDFDAVVTSDDSLAVGAVKYAHAKGISVPDQLSIIGYNNSLLSRCTDPEITSIDSRVETLCTTTVKTLMGVFSGESVPSRTTIASDLIKRNTTNF